MAEHAPDKWETRRNRLLSIRQPPGGREGVETDVPRCQLPGWESAEVVSHVWAPAGISQQTGQRYGSHDCASPLTCLMTNYESPQDGS